MIPASEMQPGAIYRLGRSATKVGNAYYVLAPKGTAKRLAKRLSARGRHITTPEQLELQAARSALAGEAVLVTRYIRGTDPFTKERFEMKDYRALPLDYLVRPVKAKPGY